MIQIGLEEHVVRIPGKPNPEGFKHWMLCESGYRYCYHFIPCLEKNFTQRKKLTPNEATQEIADQLLSHVRTALILSNLYFRFLIYSLGIPYLAPFQTFKNLKK